MKQTLITALAVGLALIFGDLAMAQTIDPLPSWNDGKAKQSIIDFVAKVTKKGSSDFVPPAERIATFDNDGTLWSEQVIGSLDKGLDEAAAKGWTVVDMKQDWKVILPNIQKAN